MRLLSTDVVRRSTAASKTSGVLVLLVASMTTPATAQAPPLEVSAVHVDVTVSEPGIATVRERYTLIGGASSHSLQLQYLSSPCARVSDVVVRSGGAPAAYSETSKQPFVILQPDSTSRGSADEVSYTVTLAAREANIPIILPTRPLATTAGYGAGGVLVTVTLPDAADRVTIPQLQRAGDAGKWEGRFIAIPAFVRVRMADDRMAASCAERREGDSGRFEWIFSAFVATLVLWVPLYLWWVERQHDAPADGGR